MGGCLSLLGIHRYGEACEWTAKLLCCTLSPSVSAPAPARWLSAIMICCMATVGAGARTELTIQAGQSQVVYHISHFPTRSRARKRGPRRARSGGVVSESLPLVGPLVGALGIRKAAVVASESLYSFQTLSYYTAVDQHPKAASPGRKQTPTWRN